MIITSNNKSLDVKRFYKFHIQRVNSLKMMRANIWFAHHYKSQKEY